MLQPVDKPQRIADASGAVFHRHADFNIQGGANTRWLTHISLWISLYLLLGNGPKKENKKKKRENPTRWWTLACFCTTTEVFASPIYRSIWGDESAAAAVWRWVIGAEQGSEESMSGPLRHLGTPGTSDPTGRQQHEPERIFTQSPVCIDYACKLITSNKNKRTGVTKHPLNSGRVMLCSRQGRDSDSKTNCI